MKRIERVKRLPVDVTHHACRVCALALGRDFAHALANAIQTGPEAGGIVTAANLSTIVAMARVGPKPLVGIGLATVAHSPAISARANGASACPAARATGRPAAVTCDDIGVINF